MSTPKNLELKIAKNLLLEFAKVGKKKMSMKDIASISGVSRQAIYKKFGTKEKCYEYILHIYIEDLYKRIFEKLESKENEPKEVLFDIFNIFLGESIEVVKKEFGTEILDDCLKYVHVSQDDWHIRFKSRLTNYLISNKLIEIEKAEARSLALILASKGLLLEKQDIEAFQTDLKIIIDNLI
jgi:AcrR family transcriptional regulator